MKLEELLGAELYAQVQAKLDEANAKEPDKLKHIRYADLSEGEYVGKGKHDALQAKFDSQAKELATANDLIEELKKGTKGDEELQGKITQYESTITNLQTELAETKVKSALKVALLSAKAKDVDYVAYKLNEKLKEKGEKLEVDDNDNIKRWDSYLTDLKAQIPDQFDGTGSDGKPKPYEPNNLPGGGGGDKTVTPEEFAKMSYEQRASLKKEDEELYKKLAKK